MCRNIKNLFNFDPAVNDEEIRAAALQYVRKVSGYNKPSKTNEAAFNAAVEAVSAITTSLLNTLETQSPPKSRLEETAKLQARSVKRFAKS